jgi:hypothetical protein
MNYLFISILINLILLLFFIISIKTSSNLNTRNKKFIYQYILYNKIKNDLKSGDLILFSNLNYSIIPRTIGHPTFSHIGIVVKYNNELYSLEMVNNDYIYPGKLPLKNNILIPLYDRIKYYSGSIYISKLLIPLSKDKEYILQSYYNHNIHFLTATDIIFKFLFVFKPKSNKQMCSQYIANILEELDILQDINHYKFWNYHKKIINLCNNTIYNHPIQIIPNDLLIDNISECKIINYC